MALLDRQGQQVRSEQSSAERMARIVETCEAFIEAIQQGAPDGRRKALAVTNAEQAVLWASAAVVQG
jgi:hypothetical protein